MIVLIKLENRCTKKFGRNSRTKWSKGGNPDQNNMPKNAARNLSFAQEGFSDQEVNQY